MKFVIHYHFTDVNHFDFMLENEDSLLTWRIEADIFDDFRKGITVEALKINNHRKVYLQFQGPISCGRGYVKLIDSGNYELTDDDSFFLSGKKFCGKVNIVNKDDSGKIFLFTYEESSSHNCNKKEVN